MRESAHPEVRSLPNVTPMIDVMLVLLIIFLIVVPTLVNGFRAIPPKASFAQAHPLAKTDHTLGIDRTGSYYLDHRQVPQGQLLADLAVLYKGSDDRVLYVRADSSLDYGVVTSAIDLARQAGVVVAGLISEAPPRGRRE